MSRIDRFREVADVGVLAVARAFGVDVNEPRLKSGGSFACPACGSEKRHTKTHDRRGAVGVRPDGKGWRCHQCDAHGDAATLAAWLVAGKPDLDGEAGVSVLRACAERGLCTPFDDAKKAVNPIPPRVAPAAVVPPRGFPPIHELEALWAATLPVDRTLVDPHVLDLGVAFYLARRGWYAPALAELDLVRVTPLPDSYEWPSWWPRGWTLDHRLVMRAYDHAGVVRSIHARSITPDATPKTRWPKGYDAAPLLFANANGAAMLRGEYAPGRVVIVEGMPDTIAMAMACADDAPTWAVIGVSSGSAAALARVAWPPGVPVVLMLHDDEAGRKYADEARAAIPRTVDLKRARLDRLIVPAEDRHGQAS